MRWLDRLRDHRELRYQRRHAPRVAPVAPDALRTIGTLLDLQADRRPDATMLVTAARSVSWQEFRTLSNRIAQMLRGLGVRQGDTVALAMGNGILHLACVVGITRLGAVAGLVNPGLVGASLLHCLHEIGPRLSLVDHAVLAAMRDCGPAGRALSPRVVHFAGDLGTRAEGAGGGTAGADPAGDAARPAGGADGADAAPEADPWLCDGEPLLHAASGDTPEPDIPVRAGDLALYIFTSGTTGLPKAARLTHRKFLYGAGGMAVLALRAGPSDRLYNCLPLYHGAGLVVGAGACLHSGASMFIAPRFSASTLVDEANRHGCNLLVYVGEVCRYLLNTPGRPDDHRCRLERAAGNGLRPDIWKPFKRRFGLKRIAEFYGASEANGGFMNVFNRDETVGITGSNVRLVRYRAEDACAERGADGFVIPVAGGEPGMMLIEVTERDRFDGYRDAAQSEQKLVRNAFVLGDCWFNSGDVLREVDVGFSYDVPHYQFVDRLGDTYRWKSENVSAGEVAERICAHPQVAFACAWGVLVPGADGKAGMVALVLAERAGPFDADGFGAFVDAHLPRPMRPLFVRVCDRFEFTGTHKIVKAGLVGEGYDLEVVADPLFCRDAVSARYVPLDRPRWQAINEGRSGY